VVAFNNAFTANVSTEYKNCVFAAEQFISRNWANPITINLTFDAGAYGTIIADSVWGVPSRVSVSYTALRSALVAHANNPDVQLAVATLPATDPTATYAGNHLWTLSQAYARMLGLSVQPGTDAVITLNTSYGWFYGWDVIDTMEHEITKYAMGRDGNCGETYSEFGSEWRPLDLFRYSSPGVRDFTDGRDGLTSYFSVDGNTLLLPFLNGYPSGFALNDVTVGDFNVPDAFGRVGPNYYALDQFSPTDYRVMNTLGWTPVTITAGPLLVSGAGDFDGNTTPDFIWRRTSDSHMGMWTYNGLVTTTDFGVIDFNWVVQGTGLFNSSLESSMLMDYVPNGTMAIWWVSNGHLTGFNLGQRWANVGFIATGPFSSIGAGDTDFLVSNLTDHHLYDWSVTFYGALQGIDLGPYWSNVSKVATGRFHFNTQTNAQDLLVSNNIDHHLYDWWIDSNNTLQGIDLGAAWSNVAFVSVGPVRYAGDSFLVANVVDHHLYDWWIGPNNTLTGTDLGPHWNNVQLVATGRFSGVNATLEFLVQNTVDHHLYDWWLTSQNQLQGIDLGLFWNNVQLVGHAHYDNHISYQELLVRNTSDNHFYEWWIAGNTLSGIDLGLSLTGGIGGGQTIAAAGDDPAATPMSPAAPTASAGSTTASPAIDASLPSPSLDSTSLMVQAMASFGASDAGDNSTGSVLSAGIAQLSEIVAPIDQRIAHA
jgi:hypothetical protein